MPLLIAPPFKVRGGGGQHLSTEIEAGDARGAYGPLLKHVRFTTDGDVVARRPSRERHDGAVQVTAPSPLRLRTAEEPARADQSPVLIGTLSTSAPTHSPGFPVLVKNSLVKLVWQSTQFA